MKNKLIPTLTLCLVATLILIGFIARTQPTPRPSNTMTASERISKGLFFGQRLVQVGPQQASEKESQLLLELLNNAAATNYKTNLAELEQYLDALTNSTWAPSLDAVLGRHYFDTGRYTLALEHWQLAYEATKNYQTGNGKKVADFTLAHWTRLLASLGRYETLTNLFQENRNRILDRGPLSQKWARTREAVADMRLHPGISYQCGTFAMNAVARQLGLTYDVRTLVNTPSPATGFSMARLAELSSQLGLGLVPVARTVGEEIPVPSVVHWQQNHYAAILSRQGELYKVVDATFGHPRYMTAETINTEASGYFLVPVNQMTANYRLLGTVETSLIYGRGNPNFLSDGDDQSCDGGGCNSCPPGSGGKGGSSFSAGDGTSGGGNGGGGKDGGGMRKSQPTNQPRPQSCNSCNGMPVWEVSEPYINLWLYDEPLGYQPALGDRVSFKLSFKQRDEPAGFFNQPSSSSVGWSWNCPWLSMVVGSEFSQVKYGMGGFAYFEVWLSEELTVGNYYNDLKLKAYTNDVYAITNYELLHPDGAKDVYGFAPTNYSGYFVGWYFLSQKISAEGHVTSFYYEDYDPYEINIRLKYVVDSDGKTNILYYATSGFSTNLITQVTDPYGWSTYLQYDENGLLTNITDTAGLSSSMAYNELGWVTNLTTPYGTTSFQPVDKGLTQAYVWDRNITITEANGGKQLYLFSQNPPYGVDSYSSSEVPTNTPIGTLDNEALYVRNSYHWGGLQYANLSTTDPDSLTESDYLKARMRHWLGATEHGYAKSMDTLSVERAYSPDGVIEGQKTWYDYPNKGPYGTGDKGDHILPGVIAQVLPDGSTRYQWMRRNEWQSPTNVVETYTKPDGTIALRTNQIFYAANGIDMTLQIGPNAEQVVSNYFGNSYHQVDASYDALGQETKFTYNANRQLTSVVRPGGLTTTNVYFVGGSSPNRLDKTIDLEISRTNSYTYANGLVDSHTDERGLTVSNYWDGLQRLVARKYPDGTTISNVYTALDITAIKDRLGYWSYASYNGIRQRVAETNANGVVTRYGYCNCGALLSVTNAWNTPAQFVTSFGYDFQGNRLYTYLPDATITNWFDSLQRVIATCDAWGCEWFGYNNQGLRTSITNAFGAKQLTTFDIEDRPIYVTDANGVTITNTYDVLGRLSTRTYPDAGMEKFGYTARGLVTYTNQLNLGTLYAYDEASRKTFETNANNEVIRYTNNAAGDLLALVDGKSQVTKWNYDEFGRVTNKLDQLAVEILRYKYDPDSRLTNRWSTAKGDTYYAYDPVGNLTNVDYPSGTTDIRYQYDPLNRVTNMVDAAGTTVYTYTAGGQLYTEDGPFPDDIVTNTYNNRLRVGMDLRQPTGVWTNKFYYDAAKRLTNVTSPAGSFTYILPSTRPSTLVTRLDLPNTSYITNNYDSVGRLLFTKLKNSSHTTLNSHTYAYNPGNQRTQQVFNVGSTYNYTYDSIGQLKVADSGTASEDRGYLYDAAWNLNKRTNNTTVSTFTVDPKNQCTNVTSIGTRTHDGNGNTTVSGSVTYTYDAENQLVSMSSGTSWKFDFIYDGRGRLRKRQNYTYVHPVGFVPADYRLYMYDGMREIQERIGNFPVASYTRGSDLSGSLEGAGGIGGMLARSENYSSGTGNWSVHEHYQADGNGNITYMVNSSQNGVASYRYDPYGNTISSSGSQAAVNLYRFSSKPVHTDSGLYYYGYRWYDPNLQRWLNRDPMGEIGGLNLYVYARNLPAIAVDPYGLQVIAPGVQPFPPGGWVRPPVGPMGPAWDPNYEPGHFHFPHDDHGDDIPHSPHPFWPPRHCSGLWSADPPPMPPTDPHNVAPGITGPIPGLSANPQFPPGMFPPAITPPWPGNGCSTCDRNLPVMRLR